MDNLLSGGKNFYTQPLYGIYPTRVHLGFIGIQTGNADLKWENLLAGCCFRIWII
jgi:hypothetical protein